MIPARNTHLSKKKKKKRAKNTHMEWTNIFSFFGKQGIELKLKWHRPPDYRYNPGSKITKHSSKSAHFLPSLYFCNNTDQFFSILFGPLDPVVSSNHLCLCFKTHGVTCNLSILKKILVIGYHMLVYLWMSYLDIFFRVLTYGVRSW